MTFSLHRTRTANRCIDSFIDWENCIILLNKPLYVLRKQAITPRTMSYFCNNNNIFWNRKVPPFAFISLVTHSLLLSDSSNSLLYFSCFPSDTIPLTLSTLLSHFSLIQTFRKALKETVALIIDEMLPIG